MKNKSLTKCVRVTITRTSVKNIEDKDGNIDIQSSLFDKEVKNFKDLNEALAWLKDQYSHIKNLVKSEIYQDLKNGETIQTGWIFAFSNSDVSHNSEPWNQEDWIELSEVQEITILDWKI